MAHFHIKRKNGRPYLYVREIARVGGKPKVVSQVYIGSPDSVAALARGDDQDAGKLRVEEFGSVWAAAKMDEGIDLASIVDQVVPCGERETGPTVGEYFLYAVLNRMVDSTSKNKLSGWYRKTAIQQIRPVDLGELTSKRFWEKWERVNEEALGEIASRFFRRLWELERPSSDCLLFDTANYYTFMASDTESELARRGNNKAGRHHLRQVGLGLLVDRMSRLPLYYRAYEGNLHDSKLFGRVMDEMFGVACGFAATKERLTVVIDKGMNAPDNYAIIDDHGRMHFITTYSTYFAHELAATPLGHFVQLTLPRNEKLVQAGREKDQLLAYRTTGEYWGKERAVVVTHNPVTARKQTYKLAVKLDRLKAELVEMSNKVNSNTPQWRDAEVVRERYIRVCEHLRLPTNLYTIDLPRLADGKLHMWFRRDHYRIKLKQASFGRNIIVTDNIDWSTADIVQASLDRWVVEQRFRVSKDSDLVSVMPMRHWTDSKIRCHLLVCVIALVYLRRLELRMREAGITDEAATIMEDLRTLHSVLAIDDKRKKPRRRIEQPTKTQAKTLRALGYKVDSQGVLQQIRS